MDHEEFTKLSLEEQERVFHQTPFRDRGDLILHSHDPNYLTKSLSQEELYLVTREMDLEERSEILRYATLPQLFFISDIDCWKKDRLNSRSFVQWLETLREADEERLLAWLVEMDYETVVAGFEQVIRVLKPEWEYPSDELLGDRPFFTLDERYFISVDEEDYETVRRAIEVLYENHRGRYVAILEGVMGELDYEMEEEAYQKRSLRLSVRGFPDPETAHHIYRPLAEGEFERSARKEVTHTRFQKGEAAGEPRPPHYLALWANDRLFLDDVLLLFREGPREIQESLEEELAWLSNKIIACDGIDFASEDRVRQGIERARRFVSLGLELLSERKLEHARGLLKERWLEIIFRWSVTRLVELRERAHRIVERYWKGKREPFLEFLEAPYDSIFRGIFHKVPLCYDPQVSDDPDQLRDFKDAQDVEKTGRALDQIDRIHEFLGDGLQNVHLGELTLQPLLATAFARFLVGGKVSFSPLSAKEAAEFLKKAFISRDSARLLNPAEKERFLTRSFSPEDQELLRPLWALVFQRLEDELGRLDFSKEIDSRFISSLYLNRTTPSHSLRK
jgi:hypothetical protein